MKNKTTNLIFIVTFLTIVHHLYAGNIMNPTHNDQQYEEGSSYEGVSQEKRTEILR